MRRQEVLKIYDRILNSSLQKWQSLNQLYNQTYDSQIRSLIESFAIIQAEREYEYNNHINDVTYSMLYNCYNIPSYHTDIVSVNITCKDNLIIKANESFDPLLSTKYDTHCINGNIERVMCINNNLQIVLNITKENLNAITFYASNDVINSIFFASEVVTAQLFNREIYSTDCICTLQPVNLYDYCFFSNLGNTFTISNLNLQAVESQLVISIPIRHACDASSLKCNVILCANEFTTTLTVESTSPNKYCLNMVAEHEIMQVVSVHTDSGLIPAARESIDGWYVSKEGEQWYLHLNVVDVCYITVRCRSFKINTSKIASVVYRPIKVISSWIHPLKILTTIKYINRLILVSQSYNHDNYSSVFELVKCYQHYAYIEYNIQSERSINVKHINGVPYIQQGVILKIQCNIKDVVFQYAMRRELAKYRSVIGVTW